MKAGSCQATAGFSYCSVTNHGTDNAIPIQGWINDPTDTDLMHLVPLLEGLQYVHDVRALLALRGGEDGQFNV
jgi:TFIIF-interacting CTD phosphatase-like protein